MKSKLLLICSLISLNILFAQNNINVSGGRFFDSSPRFTDLIGPAPADNSAYMDIKGSPFLQDNWVKSSVITKSKDVYENVYTRINILENNVRFLDSANREFVIKTPLRQIQYKDPISNKPVVLINGSMLLPARSGWFQLLVNNEMTLIKNVSKTFDQHTSYGSATEYSIKTIETYNVIFKGNEYDIKKVADIIELLPAKKSEIQTYNKGLGKLSKEDQFIAIVEYCNNLIK